MVQDNARTLGVPRPLRHGHHSWLPATVPSLATQLLIQCWPLSGLSGPWGRPSWWLLSGLPLLAGGQAEYYP